jgi:hypothetical protein
MKKLLLILFWGLFLGLSVQAQKRGESFDEDFSSYRPKYTFEREFLKEKGKILIIELSFDSLAQKTDITLALEKALDYKPVIIETFAKIRNIEGWRIQVYRGRSREDASKARQRCYELFPNMTPYMVYSAPTYRVRLGDFLEPYEYQTVLKRLKKEFPMAVAVPDIVKVILQKREYEVRDNP